MSRRTGRSGRSGAESAERHTFAGAEDSRQMLTMAVGLHQNGQLSRARALYEQILSREPRNADALQFFGLLCFQSGDPGRARELIEQAIREKPGVAPYYDNLGTVLESLGELDAALRAYERASAIEPGVADRCFNVGVVLERLSRFDQAERSYRQAIEAAPRDADYHFNLGNVLKIQNRPGEAAESYRRALSLEPGSSQICNNLGNTLLLSGDAEGAAEVFRKAVGEHPHDALLHNNLGNALRELGELESAASSYRRALELDSSSEKTYRNLGTALFRAGALDESAQVFLRALSNFPDSPGLRRGFAAAAQYLLPDVHRPQFADALAACMGDDAIQPQQLARVGARVVCLKHGLSTGDGFDPAAAAAALAGDPLALGLLRRTINVDSGLEQVLTRVRRWLLLEHAVAETRLPENLFEFCCALALQCFVNEFVFAEGAGEARAVEECLAAVQSMSETSEAQQWANRIPLIALYRPLGSLACAGVLADRDDWPTPLDGLIQRALRDPLEEAQIDAAIPSVTEIRDSTSVEVKAQYEANPYPRWIDVSRLEPQSYAEYFHRSFPHFDSASRFAGPVDVLVAGCGTGLEAVNAAIHRTGARVTGVDLSRGSLAYATGMARKLELSNVEFLLADVLELDQLDRRFDVIECSGVLHHLADPMAGWRILADCMAPDGVMKVGLYSELARTGVAAARKAILDAGYGPDPEGIRAIRRRIFDAPEDDPLAELVYSEDLFTTSACRDLLFHVCEHRFRLADISDALDVLGLRFVGFELPHSFIREGYREFNPADKTMTDLDAWSRFESNNPEIFAAMYVFWCHKPAENKAC